MANTPVYGWPYQGLADAPDGPNLGSALSLAVEATVAGIDSRTLAGYEFQQTVIFTSNGTFTKATYPGIRMVVVEVVGGGGGSGGTGATAAGAAAQGGGGGGGGYVKEQLLASALGVNETVTVGVGGTAGASTPTAGGAGGTSSFGAFCSATGGGGGATMAGTAAIGVISNAVGGAGSGGDINLTGEATAASMVLAGGIATRNNSGGRSVGPFGAMTWPLTGTGSGAAVTGLVYGNGAAGAINGPSQAARAGAVGGAGIVLVHVYV